VIDPVWALLARTYARIGARPTLLERDFNFPPYAELQGELTIRRLQATHAGAHMADAPDTLRAAARIHRPSA
jgi:uncharacterized protein (UPF0276 family)